MIPGKALHIFIDGYEIISMLTTSGFQLSPGSCCQTNNSNGISTTPTTQSFNDKQVQKSSKTVEVEQNPDGTSEVDKLSGTSRNVDS
jgi:hypothetical protein